MRRSTASRMVEQGIKPWVVLKLILGVSGVSKRPSGIPLSVCPGCRSPSMACCLAPPTIRHCSQTPLSTDPPLRRAQWQSKLGWDDVPNVNESRRHSLADIPTRRPSIAGDNRPQMGGAAFWPDGRMYDWDGGPHEEHERYSNSKLDSSLTCCDNGCPPQGRWSQDRLLQDNTHPPSPDDCLL